MYNILILSFTFRDCFNDVLKAATVHLFTKIRDVLNKPLASTGMPRHFFITIDKATPARKTVQCVIIISTYKGKKTVFPIGAPLVYKMTTMARNNGKIILMVTEK